MKISVSNVVHSAYRGICYKVLSSESELWASDRSYWHTVATFTNRRKKALFVALKSEKWTASKLETEQEQYLAVVLLNDIWTPLIKT